MTRNYSAMTSTQTAKFEMLNFFQTLLVERRTRLFHEQCSGWRVFARVSAHDVQGKKIKVEQIALLISLAEIFSAMTTDKWRSTAMPKLWFLARKESRAHVVAGCLTYLPGPCDKRIYTRDWQSFNHSKWCKKSRQNINIDTVQRKPINTSVNW